MKWPKWIMLIRHDRSAYNALKKQKKDDSLYKDFVEAFKANPAGVNTKQLAEQVFLRFSLDVSDANTPLDVGQGHGAHKTGDALRELHCGPPDVIFVSPYIRTKDTLKFLTKGWPELEKVPIYEDDRLREQEHGLASL